MDGSKSSDNSNFLVDIFMNIFKNANINMMSIFVRKLAHFTEFFILGGYLYFLFKNKLSYGMALIVAIIDESIQLFVPGRSAKLLDVLIDSTGALFGFIFVMLIFYRINKNKAIE